MLPRIARVALVGLATACGGAPKPEITVDPARGLMNLRAAENRPVLEDIVIAAVRSLPPQGSPQLLFGGVYVDGRQSREATEAVRRATGMSVVSGNRRPVVQCRAVNQSTGQSTPIACPAAAAQAIPPTLTFVEVRATADSGYVGASEAANAGTKSNCVTLRKVGNDWRVVSTLIIANPRHCGK